MKKIMTITYEKGLQEAEINGDYDSIRDTIGGYIEYIPFPGIKDLYIICDEEGKVKGLEPTFNIDYDIICGNLIICRLDDEGEIDDLTKEDIKDVLNYIYA